eukprot:567756-Hanusia_phi.AAC.1
MSADTWKTSLRIPTATGHYWFGAALPNPEEFFETIPAVVYPAVQQQKLDEMRKSLQKCADRLSDEAFNLDILHDLLDNCARDKPLAFTWDVEYYIQCSNGVQQSQSDDASGDDEEFDDPAGTKRIGDV